MRKLLFIAFSSGLVLLSTSGCIKWYCCGYPYYDYVCIKGADTAYLTVKSPPGNAQERVLDSLIRYQNNGYSCNTNNNVEIWESTETCTSGGADIRRVRASGQECDEATSYGCMHGSCER